MKMNRRDFFKAVAAITAASQLPTAFAIEEKAAVLERLGKHEFFIRSFTFNFCADICEVRLVGCGRGDWSNVELEAGFTISTKDKARWLELWSLRSKLDNGEPVVLDWSKDMTDFRLDRFVLDDMRVTHYRPLFDVTSWSDPGRSFIG